MSEEPAGLRELKSMVGVEGRPFVVEVDKTTIRRFVEAVGDGNPLWQGGQGKTMLAPPYLFCASMISGRATWPETPWPFKRGVDGGAEWEIFEQVKLGDTITSVTRLSDISEREGRSGKMYLVTAETTHRNQTGAVVGKSRSTIIGFDPL